MSNSTQKGEFEYQIHFFFVLEFELLMCTVEMLEGNKTTGATHSCRQSKEVAIFQSEVCVFVWVRAS